MEHMEKKGCSGFTLKMIAVVTMFIDHTAASVLYRALTTPEAGYITTASAYERWSSIYMLMRIIGRMAFPLYCFLLVEGFLHTKNVRKYLGRMAAFAVLSELPFDLALFNSPFDPVHNNVFVTLFFGLLVIAVFQRICEQTGFWSGLGTGIEKRIPSGNMQGVFFAVAAAATGMILCEAAGADYGASGIAAITVMYVLRKNRLAAFSAGICMLGIMSSTLEFYALLMLIPVFYYNGKRGPGQGKCGKYFFYGFYPLHLLLLAGICRWMGL